MNAAANSLGKLGVPVSCEIDFLAGALPDAEISAEARVVDTQDRIARVVVEVSQQGAPVARLTERVFLRKDEG
jgi:acyl-coenzyme A thioesterase PaaI-like protein